MLRKRYETVDGKRYYIREERIDITDMWPKSGTPDSFIAAFQQIKELYGEDCDIVVQHDTGDYYDSCYGCYYSVMISRYRRETDEERDKRLKSAAARRRSEEKRKKKIEEDQRALYKRLHAKYGE